MRILMITNYLPYPLVSGGRVRIYNLLRQVSRQHEVSLAAILESPGDADAIPHLQKLCDRVETAGIDRRSRMAKGPGMLRYALEGKPPELRLLHSEELVRKIQDMCATKDFDIVQIESVMGLYLARLPRAVSMKSIGMFQNVSSQQFARVSSVEDTWFRKVRAQLNGIALGRWEPRCAETYDRCTTVSDPDRQLLLQASPHLKIDVIPNGVDTETYQPLPPPPCNPLRSLLFVGSMGYPPCVDAMLHFCSDILPTIRRDSGGTELWIVGADPASAVLALDGDGVHVTGRVHDVVPYYQQSTVCIVPLRAGGGTRLKILEAMALARPVVSTTIGCEGLDAVDGEHLLVADTPGQFAAQTLRLLNDDQLQHRLSANARRFVEDRYSWVGIAERLMSVYNEVVAEPTRRRSSR